MSHTARFLVHLIPLLAFAAPPPEDAQAVVAFDTRNPPFMFSSGKVATGLYPRLIAEAFARARVKAELKAMPWKRALAEFAAGRLGVGGIYKTPEREAFSDFSAPFFEERLAVYARRESGLSIVSVASLYGKTVGVNAGWVYTDQLSAAIKAGKLSVDPGPGDEQNIRKLAAGRLDAVIAIVESGDLAVRAQGMEGIIARSPRLLGTNKVYLAFNKSAGMRRELALFDEAIASMKEDGTFDRILAEGLAY
jgi:polar amino acid transport system substrate-binding protein